MTMFYKSLTSPPQQIHGTTQPTYQFVVSTDDPDRDDDIIKQDGWVLDDFKRNPIALLQHKHDMPIGKWSNLTTRARPGGGYETVADLTLAPPVSDTLKYAHALVEAQILNATSVGFQAKTFEKRKDASGKPSRGHIIHKAVLREISLVSVPANQSALRIAKSLAISDDVIKSFVTNPANRVDSDIDVDSDDLTPTTLAVDKANELLAKSSFSNSVFRREPKVTDPQMLAALEAANKVLKRK